MTSVAPQRHPRSAPRRPLPKPPTYGGGMAGPTRWATETGAEHSQRYIERFRAMAAEGADLAGEARLIDAMLPRGSRVLDAGCGTGRVGAELHARGHVVVGVDADPELVSAAAHDHPGPTWLVCDLTELDLPALGHDEPFDAAVLAGNVIAFVAPDTERAMLRHVVDHLRPDGFCAVGFGADRGYDLAVFDKDLEAAGFSLEHRFATWDLRPWQDGAPFAVSVLRRPAG